MASKPKNIVIVGGGAAGASVARALVASKLDSTRYNLILLNARPHYTHLPGMVRTTVTAEGELEKKVLMPYGTDFLEGKGQVKQGRVVSFTTDSAEGGEVVLADGERVEYSILVLATGGIWEGALEMPDAADAIAGSIQSWRAKFEKATAIVLVGGGAVGIEYAGEIKDAFPGKKVTIVHGASELLNDTYPARWRRAVLARVQKTGTEVVLDDYVDNFSPSEDGLITTRKGKSIHADLVVPTRGPRPNTEFIKASLGADALTASGFVKVLPTLQLTNHPRIFAAGDIIDWKEQKQAAKTRGHAAAIASNILDIVAGKAAQTQYKGSYELISVTVGKSGGSSYFGILWGLIFGDFVTRFKSGGLLIEMTRSALGLGTY